MVRFFCSITFLFSTGDMDGMKNSPANGRGTPREDMPPVSGVGGGDMGPYGLGGYQDSVSLGLFM